MSITESYDQTIRPLAPSDRLQLARLILDHIAPESVIDESTEWTDEDLRDFSRAGWVRAVLTMPSLLFIQPSRRP